MTVLRRVDRANGPAASAGTLGAHVAGRFPALEEYMTCAVWGDGKVREVATLLLVVEAGRVKLMLRDRANRRMVWVSGEDVLDAVQALEDALSGDRAEWRADRFGQAQGKHR